MTAEQTQALVPDRACGACNVCCVALTIDDDGLRKPQGVRCRHARHDNSCAIYADRPRTCRSFYCGWRRFRWVSALLRPDVSGVLIREHLHIDAATGREDWGVSIMPLNAAATRADGLAETVAAAVYAGLRVYLNVPGRPGFTAAHARIDEALLPAVLLRDKAQVLDLLSEMWAAAGTGKRRRIGFGKRTVN